MALIARRRFLGTLLAAGAAPVLPAGESADRCFVGCRVNREGRYLASIFDQSGRIRHDVPLPGRGHGFAVQPTTGRVVVFARRPDDWALVVNPATGAVLGQLNTSPGRHFYGHGAFSPDGAFLFTSENRFEDGEGVIGGVACREALAADRRVVELRRGSARDPRVRARDEARGS